MAMSIGSDSVLVESRAARDHQLGGMSDDNLPSIVSKLKRLYFALLQGTGAATTVQMSEFYPEVL